MNLPTLIRAWSVSLQISTPWTRWYVGIHPLRFAFYFGRTPDVVWLQLGPLLISSGKPFEYSDKPPYDIKR